MRLRKRGAFDWSFQNPPIFFEFDGGIQTPDRCVRIAHDYSEKIVFRPTLERRGNTEGSVRNQHRRLDERIHQFPFAMHGILWGNTPLFRPKSDHLHPAFNQRREIFPAKTSAVVAAKNDSRRKPVAFGKFPRNRSERARKGIAEKRSGRNGRADLMR